MPTTNETAPGPPARARGARGTARRTNPHEDLGPRTWLVMTFDGERSYRGNTGYADERGRWYRYDQFVPNHARVAAGDLLALRDRDGLVGVARVNAVEAAVEEKTFRRCPTCRDTRLTERRTKRPTFRCSAGHEFDALLVEAVRCRTYAAALGGFAPANAPVSVAELRAACDRYARQLSIQPINPRALALIADRTVPGSAPLFGPLRDAPRATSGGRAGEWVAGDAPADTERQGAYTPADRDERAYAARVIALRRGQAAFRRRLLERFGGRCAVSGSEIVALLDAAHVDPYRGPQSNHPANGLLLRTDLHTLFDLDLLAVDPATGRVRVHPDLRDPTYGTLDGARVSWPAAGPPDAAAVGRRWDRYVARSRRPAADPADPTLDPAGGCV